MASHCERSQSGVHRLALGDSCLQGARFGRPRLADPATARSSGRAREEPHARQAQTRGAELCGGDGGCFVCAADREAAGDVWPSLGQTAAALVMRGQGGEMGLGGAAASLRGGCKGRGVQGLKGIPSGDVAALRWLAACAPAATAVEPLAEGVSACVSGWVGGWAGRRVRCVYMCAQRTARLGSSQVS